jgi:hypothetical protein
MTSAAAAEAELRTLLAEVIGSLRLISEGAGPLQRDPVRALLSKAARGLEAAHVLADRLP